MEQKYYAFKAAERIINCVEEAGFDVFDPNSIINGDWNLAREYFNLAYGASRLVIWDEVYDYVIKVAFDGYEKYNQHEVEVYQSAVACGFEKEFGWCDCIIEPVYEGDKVIVPGIYVMEFLDGNEEEVLDSAYDYGYKRFCESRGLDSSTYQYTDDYDEVREDDMDELMDCFVSYIDNDKRGKFERFLCDHHVNDIHNGNVLFRNNKMVICDYAGWGW